jgi:hypothetical protein
MELVFEAKEKKMSINLYGHSYSIRVPKIKDGDELRTKLENADAKDAMKIYSDFFLSIGIPQEAIDSLDSIDFNDLIMFLLYPKKS